MSQRDIFTQRVLIRSGSDYRTATLWVVPGSRLLPTSARLFNTPTRIREDAGIHAKAAPLQALGDHTFQ
jgi:hypothetical protein